MNNHWNNCQNGDIAFMSFKTVSLVFLSWITTWINAKSYRYGWPMSIMIVLDKFMKDAWLIWSIKDWITNEIVGRMDTMLL